MKDWQNLLSLLCSLMLFCSPRAYAQLAHDPQRDVSVTFSSRHEGQDPGAVFGVVRNNSTTAYPCVRIAFDLYTRFDLRPPGQKGRHLGVLYVEVKNIQPRSVRDFEQRLPYPAGVGLESVRSCQELPDAPEILSFTVTPKRIHAGATATLQWRTANTDHVFVGEGNLGWSRTSPEPIVAPRAVKSSGSLQVSPSQTVKYRLQAQKGGRSTFNDVAVEVTNPATPKATCSITGRIFGKLQWDVRGDRGQPYSVKLTHICMTTPGADPVRAPVRQGKYKFSNVAAGKTYRISPDNFRAQPRYITVSCQPNISYTGKDFKITGPPPFE
jgi:hypothetical protein